MNRATAKQFVSILPAILGALSAFPAAVEHLSKVSPVMNAFGKGEDISVGSMAVFGDEQEELAFNDVEPNIYSVIPDKVRFQANGAVYELDVPAALATGHARIQRPSTPKPQVSSPKELADLIDLMEHIAKLR